MRFDTTPVLASESLLLRPLGAADVAAWYSYLSIPATLEHTSWNLAGPGDLAKLVEWYESSEPESAARFAIVEKGSDALVGTIGFRPIPLAHRTAEIAYDVDPRFARRGIATLACRAAVAWGFASRGYVRIQACVLETNVASLRVLEKCGFALEGKLRSYRMVRGAPRDFLLYSVVANERPAAPG